MTDRQYWRTLSELWTDAEFVHLSLCDWLMFLSSERTEQKYFMTTEERRIFDRLPEEITIYRGCIKNKNERGLSWTLEYDRARWFSKRFAVDGRDVPVVLERSINKSQALGYLTGREECELVLRPSELIDTAWLHRTVRKTAKRFGNSGCNQLTLTANGGTVLVFKPWDESVMPTAYQCPTRAPQFTLAQAG
jgi:hypothetical protein